MTALHRVGFVGVVLVCVGCGESDVPATESELRDVLQAVYDEVDGHTGFQYHPTPTLVALSI